MSDVSLVISPDVIKPIMEAKIKAALLDGLGKGKQ